MRKSLLLLLAAGCWAAEPARHYYSGAIRVDLQELTPQQAVAFLMQEPGQSQFETLARKIGLPLLERAGFRTGQVAFAANPTNVNALLNRIKDHLGIQQAVRLRCFRRGGRTVWVEYPEVLVRFKDAARGQEFLRRNYAVTVAPASTPGEYLVRLLTPHQTLDLANVLNSRKDLAEYAAPNFRWLSPFSTSPVRHPVWPSAGPPVPGRPPDPGFSLQWGLANAGPTELFKTLYKNATPAFDVRALPAWPNLPKHANPVRVAVLDFAVDVGHKDLEGRLGPVFNATNNSEKLEPDERADHGTAVAGIIGAAWNNFGIAGLVPHVQILPIQISQMNTDGSWTGLTQNTLTAAMNRAASADVIVMSWGMESVGADISTPVDQAIRRLSSARGGKGVLLVVAAGNDDLGNLTGMDYPARLHENPDMPVLAVGASNWCGGIKEKGDFSCDGEAWRSKRPLNAQAPLLLGPGVGVVTTSHMRVPGSPNDPRNYRANFNGTSAAAPFVAAAAAMMVYGDSSLTAQEIKKKLWETGTPLKNTTYRMLNTCAALGGSNCQPSL